MLSNPKWAIDAIKSGDIEGFISWMKQQDANREVHFVNGNTCPIGRYLKECGVSFPDNILYTREIPKRLCDALSHNNTYGEVLAAMGRG